MVELTHREYGCRFCGMVPPKGNCLKHDGSCVDLPMELPTEEEIAYLDQCMVCGLRPDHPNHSEPGKCAADSPRMGEEEFDPYRDIPWPP